MAKRNVGPPIVPQGGPPIILIPASEPESPEIADQVRDEGIGLSPLGATGVFRGTTECGYGPTKESDSPVTKVGMEGPLIIII